MSNKKRNDFPITYSKELLDANFEGEPIRILFKLMDQHVWFGDHLIKKYHHDQFAKDCGISKWTLIRHLKYLRRNKLILKYHPDHREEYINPRYVYQCTQEKRKDLMDSICLGKSVMIYGDPMEAPDPDPIVENPKLSFKGMKPAIPGSELHQLFNQLEKAII
jgi:hypothetical protein